MSSVEQERDARLFLEELYGPEPDGLIAITTAPDWHKPVCCKAPTGALYYVVGKRDVYFRLGTRCQGAAEEQARLRERHDHDPRRLGRDRPQRLP